MRPVVRDLYKQILVVGRAYPAGLDAVRDRAKREFRERADLRSEAEIRKAVGYVKRYMLREMRALIQLKKYRTLKAKGYGARRSGEMALAGVRGDVDSDEDNEELARVPGAPRRRLAPASLHVPGRPRSSWPARAAAGRPAAGADGRGVDDFGAGGKQGNDCGRPGLTVREAAQLLRDADRAGGESAGWLPLESRTGGRRGRAAGRRPGNERPAAQHMGGATTELVERLLAYGASPNERVRANTQGRAATGSPTPLHWAARGTTPRGRADARRGARRYPRQSRRGATRLPRRAAATTLASLILDPFGGAAA